MTSIQQQIEQLLEQKAEIDRDNPRDNSLMIKNIMAYSVWLINAVELLLYIEQERHNTEASK